MTVIFLVKFSHLNFFKQKPKLEQFTCTYNHGQKSWDTFAFLGCFSIHTSPTPPLTPQTMLDACIQIQLCIGWGEGELQENFENDAVLRGSREITEKYAYCSTVIAHE